MAIKKLLSKIYPMKSHSKSILYVVQENDKVIPIDVLRERIQNTLFNLSKFDKIKLIFRYSTKAGDIIHLLSMDNLKYENNHNLTEYILKRLDFGLTHALSEIQAFSLSYSYDRPLFVK